MASISAANPGIRYPKFAIIRLGTQPDIAYLFNKLQELGYFEVSFVHDLCDSPYYSGSLSSPTPPHSFCSLSPSEVPKEKRRGRKRKTLEVIHKIPHPPASPPFRISQKEEIKAEITESDDVQPTATIEIVESELPLSSIVFDESEGGEEGIQTGECSEFADGAAETVALAQLFSKERNNAQRHGFARERDYKYKLESGIQNCEECGRQFVQSQFKNILAHAKSHYQMKAWACPLCPEQAADEMIMQRHIEREHPDSEGEPISNGIACERLRSEWASVARRCFPKLEERIDKWEQNVKKIYAAQRAEANTTVGVSVVEQLSQKVRAEQVMNGGKWVGNLHIPCKLCGKVLACRDVSILVRHTKTHHPIKQYSCAICDYTNAERRNMRQHMEGTHPDNEVVFLDRRDLIMEECWMRVGADCFPEMSTRLNEAISSYKPKSKAGQKMENDMLDFHSSASGGESPGNP